MCKETFKPQADGCTSSLRTHLKLKHKINVPSTRNKKRKQAPYPAHRITSHFVSSTTSSSTSRPSIDKKQLGVLLLRMVVEMNVSFRGLTECTALKELLHDTLGFQMPSRMSLMRLLPTYYTSLLDSLNGELATVESLSITTDSTFLTSHQVPYICVTGHWIDDEWNLQNRVLSVFLAEQSETADFITTSLRDVLEAKLGLNRKLHCIVTDEGKNFLSATENLKTAEVLRESLRCACHRFQLTFKKAIMAEQCRPLLTLLNKCSNVTQQFKNGWMSSKRDILARNQVLYLTDLSAEINRLENEMSHNTRTIAEVLETKQAELLAAQNQLEIEKSERLRNKAKTSQIAVETSELSLIDDEKNVSDDEDDDEQNENEDENPDTEAEELEAEALALEQMKRKNAEHVANMKEYVDYIFRKRALVQKAATRWLTYVHVVKRTLMWRKALMKSLDEIRADKSIKKKKKGNTDVEAEVNALRISDDDAKVLTQFLMIGEGARTVLEALEGGNHVTISSLLFHQCRLQNYLNKCIANAEFLPMIRKFAEIALDNSKIKFSADVDRPALIAAALDPRFRNLAELPVTEAAKCRESAKNAFIELKLQIERAAGVMPQPKKKKIGDFGADILDNSSPSKSSVQTEFEDFTEQKNVPRETDVLLWWKMHASEFPVLAILARQYLAIPASSAASERLFSRLKLVATTARQNMSPETLCMLLFVNQHLNRLGTQ
jgi:hypothetical protein